MATAASVSGLFLGDSGKLRPIWRALVYVLLVSVVAMPAINLLLDEVLGPAPAGPLRLDPLDVSLAESVNFAAALLITALFAWYEHRRINSYGLPTGLALKSPTWEGVCVGIVQTSVVALTMYALGAMQIHGLALSGSAIITSALAWLGACLCIGVAEEFLIRSYLLQTLWKAIGFWPASAVIAAIFAGVHYLLKPGENLWDMIALVSFSVLCCYSVLRTGTLWFAVGLHVAYDYMQLFIIGTPNGGHFPVGRLLDASFDGPAWLTGGPLGTEASWLSYPLDALAFLYLWWRFRRNPQFEPHMRCEV